MQTKTIFSLSVLASLALLGAGCAKTQPAMDLDNTNTMKNTAPAMMEKTEGSGNNAMDDKVKDSAMMENNKPDSATTTMMDKKTDTTATAGTYENYAPEKLALAKTGKVILFFKATWCPTCKEIDTDITKNLKNIPSDVHILTVDYDTAVALKQKYAVTYQHTFVQVDATGNQLKKWSGSPTLADLLKSLNS